MPEAAESSMEILTNTCPSPPKPQVAVISGVGTNLLAYQHLPVARTAEAMADLVGMDVSTGWVSGPVGNAGSAGAVPPRGVLPSR